jgi:hypothetical protein
MKYIKLALAMLVMAFVATACQDKDYDIAAPILQPIDADAISGQLVGDDYVWTWTAQTDKQMVVNTYVNNVLSSSETVSGNSFTHRNIDTGITYTYVFKVTDGTNLSSGVVKSYTRPGASKMTGLSMSQVDKTGGYDALVVWDANSSATSVDFTATNGSRTIHETFSNSTTQYTISNVVYNEEWTVTLVAVNNEGSSLPVSTTLKIGKTAIGFLSVYATPEELVANGDDDEASAWLWTHEQYPTAQFVYFGDIASTADLDAFRVLFWMRDLENVDALAVFEMPEVVKAATPAIREWYTNGGSLLLWSHATVYVGELGRVKTELLKASYAIGTSVGGINNDVWNTAISLNPGSKFSKDHSTHPIYRGLSITSNDRCKLVPFKGPGWTEDHNCLFFDIPTALTGIGNQEESCYTTLTEEYGIYPLGTWDSQIDYISQLNIWEAQQGNTEFKGTILCIGNGGCEFSMKNTDGTPDVSAHPSNNIYQDNVLTLAKNSLEYLKTR